MYKKIILITTIFLLLLPNNAWASFRDVGANNKYSRAVEYLENQGVVKGGEKIKFYPEKRITKAEFLKIIIDESKLVISKKSVVTGFKDVKRDIWYAPYVKKALDLGIINKGENFNPNKTVKKGEALEMIFDLKGIGIPIIISKDTLFDFVDINRDSKYAGIAIAATQKQIFPGTNLLQPMKSLNKGEVADILFMLNTSEVTTNIPTINIEISTLPETNGVNRHEKFPILVDVWNKILSTYLRNNEVTEDEMLYGAIEGMVDKLGDKYSTFQEPIEAAAFQAELQSNFEGIGVMVEMIDDNFTVVAPLPGTPAYEAGMQPADIVTHVDNVDVREMSLEEIVNRIKGPAGTSVQLKIDREGNIVELTIVRAKINLEAVSGEIVQPSGIGLITITSFTQNSGQEFAQVAADLVSQGAKGIVIDLRNNPGGFLDAVVSMLLNYVNQGSEILSTVHGNGTIEKVISSGPGDLAKIKTMVLVNKGTASASEIFAGVLQDYKVATIIGETTFGKGTVQQLINYGDGSTLKLTIAKWLTSLGRDINEVGVTPDIEITDNKSTGYDEVLDRALQEILKN